jgi:hypothetical protein
VGAVQAPCKATGWSQEGPWTPVCLTLNEPQSWTINHPLRLPNNQSKDHEPNATTAFEAINGVIKPLQTRPGASFSQQLVPCAHPNPLRWQAKGSMWPRSPHCLQHKGLGLVDTRKTQQPPKNVLHFYCSPSTRCPSHVCIFIPVTSLMCSKSPADSHGPQQNKRATSRQRQLPGGVHRFGPDASLSSGMRMQAPTHTTSSFPRSHTKKCWSRMPHWWT